MSKNQIITMTVHALNNQFCNDHTSSFFQGCIMENFDKIKDTKHSAESKDIVNNSKMQSVHKKDMSVICIFVVC